MGSLPNLHELEKLEVITNTEPTVFTPVPLLDNTVCAGHDATLSEEERSKIQQRCSTHNRITKVRSNPEDPNRILHDDRRIEQPVAAVIHSPALSSRSRLNIHLQSGQMKRIDSMASSIGATSVRRLISVVRGGHPGISKDGNLGGEFSRTILFGNVFIISVCHLLTTSATLPFLTLQSSVSVWVWAITNSGFAFNTGSLLSSLMFIFAALFALLAPSAVRIFGSTTITVICYAGFAISFGAHIYPYAGVIIPISIIFGILYGLLSSAQVSFIMILSHKMTSLFQDDDEDGKYGRKTCAIRRVARAFQGAQDIGLIFGSLFSFLIIHLTINLTHILSTVNYGNGTMTENDCIINITSNSVSKTICSNETMSLIVASASPYDYNAFLDDIYDINEDGRLCGAQACPRYSFTNSSFLSGFRLLPEATAEILIFTYAGMSAMAFLLAAIGLDKIRILVQHDSLQHGLAITTLISVKESFRDSRLQMAAPLSFFIGLEQAFMYSDFSASYVVCTLGIHRLNLVFLAMGVLQSVAACTLSMLLRTVRRYYVVAVGFAFQICLIMVLILWKPIADDPAQFYVISAAWGVCNAIWEMITFTLLTGQYADHWEAPFANRNFFKFIGFSVAFAFHSLLCNYMKLYILAFVLIVSVIPFALLEYKLEHVRKIKNITRL